MRKMRGPFPEISSLTSITALTMEEALPEDLAVRASELNDILAAHGCNCVGHNKGLQENPGDPGLFHRDEFFAGDLAEFAARSLPHAIAPDPVDNTPISVAIQLETLRAEVDEYNEVCAWIYEES